MHLTQVGDAFPPAFATADLVETSESPSLATISELEGLIERELRDELPGSLCSDLPVSERQIAHEAALLAQRHLSDDLSSWVERYETVGNRAPYLWMWCRQGAGVTTLPCVSEGWREAVADAKFLGMMFDVLLDDVADQGGGADFLEQLIRLTQSNSPSDWSSFTDEEQRYAAFSSEVRRELQDRVQQFPRYDEFADLLRFDYLQLMNTMRYAHFLNRFPCFLNLAEHDLYLPHNMMMMICATMDLMCSPEFDFCEIGHLRQATCHAQHMGRIGNLITTWEREIQEADFTSGVFARAVMRGDLTQEQLATGDRELIEDAIRAGQHEEYFLFKWREHREQILALQPSISSVDLLCVVENLDRLICLHFASRGRK